MCSILWVCCFLSRWYFKENDFFLFFRPSLTLSFKKVNAASVQFHVLARKLEKNSNRQIPLILLLANIHGFLTCEYRQHEVFRFG